MLSIVLELHQLFQGKQKASTTKWNADPEARPQLGELDRLSNVLIEHIKAMTDNTLKSIKWEDLMKPVLSQLSGAAAHLFILPAAKD